jgi:pilus assembly protein CpaE
MNAKTKLNIIGKETVTIKIVETALSTKEAYDVSTHYLRESSDDNVVDLCKTDESTIYILSLTENWQTEITSVREKYQLASNPLLVFGPDNTKAMREALQMGAVDYYSNPEQLVELDSAIKTIIDELAIVQEQKLETENKIEKKTNIVTTVINTEGGAGASFISANIAHLFASQHNQHVALLDMDVQFGSHALNLDLT